MPITLGGKETCTYYRVCAYYEVAAPTVLQKGTAHFLHMKMVSASVVAGGDAIFVLSCVIRGHHIYKTVWSPSTGEILEAAREPNNPHDHHAVCLRETEVIVGHGYRRAPPPSQGTARSPAIPGPLHEHERVNV